MTHRHRRMLSREATNQFELALARLAKAKQDPGKVVLGVTGDEAMRVAVHGLLQRIETDPQGVFDDVATLRIRGLHVAA